MGEPDQELERLDACSEQVRQSLSAGKPFSLPSGPLSSVTKSQRSDLSLFDLVPTSPRKLASGSNNRTVLVQALHAALLQVALLEMSAVERPPS